MPKVNVTATKPARVPAYIDELQSQGRYTLLREEVCAEVGGTEVAIQNSLWRLLKKNRIVNPRRGFFVIVPLEYRTAGVPPASWFIDALMRYMRQPYYVGLRSAAVVHGTIPSVKEPHQVEPFQIITTKPIREIVVGNLRLCFITKRNLASTPVMEVKSVTGTMRVSTPEATALDLVRYQSQVGHLITVVPMLRDLAKTLDPARLMAAAQAEIELSCVQRFGYLMELVGQMPLVQPLWQWLQDQKRAAVLLKPGLYVAGVPTNRRWSVVVNDEIR